MSTQPLEVDGILYRPESALRRGLRRLTRRATRTAGAAMATAVRSVASAAKARTVPAAKHVQEHAYSIIGLGMFDAAMFVHSVFTGLLVTGISFLVFEWKVTPEGTDESS